MDHGVNKADRANSGASASCTRVKLGELDAVEVRDSASGAVVRVCLFGATVYSFEDADGVERLFLSASSKLDGSKPVRGGVPLVFPQFGAGRLPNHGFARTSVWELCGDAQTRDGVSVVSFRLCSSEASLKLWPHAFELIYTVRFGPRSLETCMTVRNTGDRAFEFNALLHTYYRVGAIGDVRVMGLQGLSYMNQLENRARAEESRSEIAFEAETDAIYTRAENAVAVRDASTDTLVEVRMELARGAERENCDAVLWNPWVDKARRMDDFGDDEYKVMFCLEPGCVSRFEVCAPGESWTLTQFSSFARI